MQEHHIWVCANLHKKTTTTVEQSVIETKFPLLKQNYLTGCGKSFRPSAATNQQKSVRDVVQLSQIQIIATSEAIQQVHHNN